jgi:hypothetical protein
VFKTLKIKLIAALRAISFSGMAFAKLDRRLTFSTYWPTSYNYLIDSIFSFAKKVDPRRHFVHCVPTTLLWLPFS